MRSRAHIFQPLLQRSGSLGTAGTRAQPAELPRLLQLLGTTSMLHWSPPGWWETWSTWLRGRACAEKPEACKVKHVCSLPPALPCYHGRAGTMCLSKSFPLARSLSVAILIINSIGWKQLSLYSEVQTMSWFCRAFWGMSMAAGLGREGDIQ